MLNLPTFFSKRSGSEIVNISTVTGVMKYYQPKQCTIKTWKLLENIMEFNDASLCELRSNVQAGGCDRFHIHDETICRFECFVSTHLWYCIWEYFPVSTLKNFKPVTNCSISQKHAKTSNNSNNHHFLGKDARTY